MKQISFWARDHKYIARAILFFIYILLNLIGLFLGDLLYSLHFELTPLFFVVATLVTLCGWMLYPNRKRKNSYKNFFKRQKSADLLLGTATFLFIVFTGNVLNKTGEIFKNPVQAASINFNYFDSSISSTPLATSSVSKKTLRKKVRDVIKEIRKRYKESTKSQKTLYIILAIMGASLLLSGVGALSCSLSCSGYEAMAFIVAFIGLGGIIFGLIKLIQRIQRGKPKDK